MSLGPHDLWGKASPFPLSAFFLSINDTTFELKTRFYLWSTVTLRDLVPRFFSCGWTHFWTLFWSLAVVSLNPGHWIQGSTSPQLEDCPEWATLSKPSPSLPNPRLCCDRGCPGGVPAHVPPWEERLPSLCLRLTPQRDIDARQGLSAHPKKSYTQCTTCSSPALLIK